MYVIEVIPPDTHTYGGINFKVPLLHRYNTRAIFVKGYNLISNHVTTIPPPRQMPTPAPTNKNLQKTVEDWLHTNSTTGGVKICPGIINNFIFPETVRYQYYRHLMKGVKQLK